MRATLLAMVLRRCDALLGALLALAMLALVAINFANVVARYVFAAPLPAADEIMTFTMVWGVFLGAGLVSLRGGHLSMDLAVGLLPARAKRAVGAAAALASVLVLGFMFVHSLEYLATIGAIGLTSMGGGIPMTVPHLALPVGFLLMIAGGLLRLAAGPAEDPTG
ncbi:MAG: TRAP transporter small permease [Acetobacteraceae bacterium]|nr:TRAP transporter small permease [Acetobacteraceae bacterium]MCX7685495.1 TRAP transporter small permease [Acetobacteraceae bacterium]MDW8396997.1 TRAP transporter small permease [Acetobacteraceae bacterium]